jgi:hypothetical protein
VLVEDAVAVRVFVNGDFVATLHSSRRGLGNLVINSAPEFIAADCCQSGGRRVLEVLHHPHPAALIEIQKDGLLDDRLSEHQFHLQIVGDLEGLRAVNWT